MLWHWGRRAGGGGAGARPEGMAHHPQGHGVRPGGMARRLQECGAQCRWGGAAVMAPHQDCAARGSTLPPHSSSFANNWFLSGAF